MTKADHQQAASYVVIGATENSDDVPLRLRPVLRTRQAPYQYALVFEEDDGSEVLVQEDEEFIEEHIREGNFYELPYPRTHKPGHWFLRLTRDRVPEYLPAERAKERLYSEGQKALEECAGAVKRDDHETARERVGYARLAMPENPIPVLARIALWRPALSPSQLRWELRALDDFSANDIKRRFDALRRKRALSALIKHIEDDELAGRYSLRRKWLLRARPKNAPRSPAEYWRYARQETPAAA